MNQCFQAFLGLIGDLFQIYLRTLIDVSPLVNYFPKTNIFRQLMVGVTLVKSHVLFQISTCGEI